MCVSHIILKGKRVVSRPVADKERVENCIQRSLFIGASCSTGGGTLREKSAKIVRATSPSLAAVRDRV